MFGPEQLVLIITAIITLVGLFVPILIGPIANFIFTKPFVIFEYSNDDTSSKVKNLVIQNFGQGPATNISLLIESSGGKIMSLINKFGNQQIFYNNLEVGLNNKTYVDNNILYLKMPLLTQGIGSKVYLQLELEKVSTSLNRGSAVFEEGSTLMEKSEGNILLIFIKQWVYYPVVSALIVFSILLTIGLTITAIRYDKWKNNKEILASITKDVIKNRDSILSDKYGTINKQNFDVDTLFNNNFLDTPSYGLIKKYYSTLVQRNDEITRQNRVIVGKDYSEVEHLNRLIMFITEDIIRIPWKKFEIVKL